MTIEIDIIGAGIATPGIPDWTALQAVADGGELMADTSPPPSTLLSTRERRRAPATVKLSFAAAEQACAMAGMPPERPAAVFSSAMGDLEINDYMCRTLAANPHELSPTRFHNSVHNGAAGYWSIGTGSRGDVTAISAWRDSVIAGLFESVTRLASSEEPVLLVVYDDCARGPFRELWPTRHPFAAAVLMASKSTNSSALAGLQVTPAIGPDQHSDLPVSLNKRIADNPSARILPVLTMIAGDRPTNVTLAAEHGSGLRLSRNRA